MMGALIQDIKFAIRVLAKSPGFTAVVVLSLGLGIGANTAIFTLIDAVMFKTLPVRKPERLVLFHNQPNEGTRVSRGGMGTGGRWDYYSYPLYVYLRDHNEFFDGLAAFRQGENLLSASFEGASAGSRVQQVNGHLVSGNYFSVLSVNAMLGRTLTPDDDQPGARPAAVISYGYWKQGFGSDPAAVGKVVDLNGTPFAVVGVMPPEFFGERVRRSPDLWLPLSTQPQVMLRESYLHDSGVMWLNLMGRLKPGVTLQQAQSALTVQLRQFLTGDMGSKISEDDRKEIRKSFIQLFPGSRGISGLRANYSATLQILMGVVALVLLIACANVANLLLSRSTVRHKEISMRMALGAGRGRLIRQMLTESLMLAGIGGALGALFAVWGVGVLVSRFAGHSSPLNVSPDLRVLGFTLGVCVLAAIFFGVVPALRATQLDLAPTLKSPSAGQGSDGRGWSLGKGLVSFQAALSLLLLVGAGLLVRTLQNLESAELGFNREHVLLVGIDPRLGGYKPEQLTPLYQRLQDGISVLPGVRSATLATYSPLSGTSSSSDISVQGHTPRKGENTDVNINVVGWKYFETIGTPLLLGREIGSQDTANSQAVAVINNTIARDFFGGQNPIGKRFGFGTDPKDSGDFEIVGVVADAKYRDQRQKPQRMVFLPVMQRKDSSSYIAELEVRTSGNPTAIVAEVRNAIGNMDRSLPITNVTTLSRQVDGSLGEERNISQLCGIFGLLALGLACVGLYGVMAYTVARRTSEIGIRMALGARSTEVLWMVLREALLLVLAGVAVGLPATLAASRLMSTMLFGLSPWDPLTIAFAALVLVAVATGAGYIPARRASRVSPLVALRYE
jgi:predicted permease